MTPAEAHAWLVAQVQADLDAARAAGSVAERWITANELFGMSVRSVHNGGQSLDAEECEHIARWNPARAIAELEARLRRLERHEPAFVTVDELFVGILQPCDECCGCNRIWPCLEALDDAAPYIDREGFPDELRQ